MHFGPYGGPYEISGLALLDVASEHGGLQNRNARFDSWVPRSERHAARGGQTSGPMRRTTAAPAGCPRNGRSARHRGFEPSVV